MGHFTFKAVVDSLRSGNKNLLYISLEDPISINSGNFRRPYETTSRSIFDMLVERSEKQLMDHVRPSIMMMRIRIAQLSIKHQI